MGPVWNRGDEGLKSDSHGGNEGEVDTVQCQHRDVLKRERERPGRFAMGSRIQVSEYVCLYNNKVGRAINIKV